MKRWAIVFSVFLLLAFFLSLSSPGHAQGDLTGKSYLVVESDINSNIEAKPTSGNAQLEHLIADLYFFPKESNTMRIIDRKATPSAQLNGNNIEWVWIENQEQFDFGVKSVVKTFPTFAGIKEKIDFPLPILEPSLSKYIVATENIDVNHPEIIAAASSLAEGETDLFRVVTKIAYWTRHHVEYDLNTLTAEVTQKASWVLENKKGVCDEVTNLFIALNRALGIPARFVSGVSYTNSERNQWAPHGWAEVYFPGYGWVPFDPTYGQYAWVDAAHIKMKESLDPSEPSTEYEWRGRDIHIKTQQLIFDTQIKEVGQNLPSLLKVDVVALKNNIGFGSANLFTATITNLQPFYLAEEISISKNEELHVLDDEQQLVILPPQGYATVHWRVQTKKDLDEEYKYTIPMLVYSSRNESGSVSFIVEKNNAQYSLQEITKSYQQLSEEDKKVYSKQVDLSCGVGESKFYENEQNNVTCTIRNRGNVYLERLQVCLGKRCKEDVSIGIGQSRKIIFPISWSEEGNKALEVTLKNHEITKTVSVDLERSDLPNLEIASVEAPNVVEYDDVFTVNFTVRRTSEDPPQDVVVTFTRGKSEKKWLIPELHEQVYSITLYAEDFDAMQNSFGISAKFTGPEGDEIKEERKVVVQLDPETVSVYRGIKMWFNKLVNWVEGWF